MIKNAKAEGRQGCTIHGGFPQPDSFVAASAMARPFMSAGRYAFRDLPRAAGTGFPGITICWVSIAFFF